MSKHLPLREAVLLSLEHAGRLSPAPRSIGIPMLLPHVSTAGEPVAAAAPREEASVCVERQESRTANRRVPEQTAMVDAWPGLPAEGFDHVVVAENLHRLQPLLQRLGDARRADLGWDTATASQRSGSEQTASSSSCAPTSTGRVTSASRPWRAARTTTNARARRGCRSTT